jgi:hypothetical protein
VDDSRTLRDNLDELGTTKHTFVIEVDLNLGWGFPRSCTAAYVELTLRDAAEEALVQLQPRLGAPPEPILIRCAGHEETRRCEGCGEQLGDRELCALNAAAAADPSIAGCGQGGYYSCDEHGVYDVTPGALWACPDCDAAAAGDNAGS